MVTLTMRASVYSTTVRTDLVSVDGKLDQEPLCNLAHVVNATMRLYGFPWDAIQLGFQLHPNDIG